MVLTRITDSAHSEAILHCACTEYLITWSRATTKSSFLSLKTMPKATFFYVDDVQVTAVGVEDLNAFDVTNVNTAVAVHGNRIRSAQLAGLIASTTKTIDKLPVATKFEDRIVESAECVDVTRPSTATRILNSESPLAVLIAAGIFSVTFRLNQTQRCRLDCCATPSLIHHPLRPKRHQIPISRIPTSQASLQSRPDNDLRLHRSRHKPCLCDPQRARAGATCGHQNSID